MVLECLRRGSVRRPPEQNIKTGWYECRMERYTGGKNVAVVVALEDANPSTTGELPDVWCQRMSERQPICGSMVELACQSSGGAPAASG